MEEAYGRLARRLRRILLLLPYAIRHPGVGVDELAKKFGVRKQDLIDDLNLVFMCGLPGYGPGDLIDVSFDEDRVYVRMADYFAAPLRLSPAEALVLYAAGAALAQLPGMEEADALRKALAKLGRALGTEGGEGGAVQVHLEGGPVAHLDAIRRALEERRRLQLEYFSASRGALSERAVDPWGLIAALGRWYLVGLDHLTGEERMFRVDRIKSATILETTAEVPHDFDPGRYRGAYRGEGGGEAVAFEISPSAAQWFEDYYPVTSSSPLHDGWRRVELVSSGRFWIATLLLRLGADARNVAPEGVVQETRVLAEAIAAAYR